MPFGGRESGVRDARGHLQGRLLRVADGDTPADVDRVYGLAARSGDVCHPFRSAPPPADGASLDGERTSPTRDEILDNITLYWLTNTAVSAARLYRENTFNYFSPKNVTIPAGVSVFPDELYLPPRSWAERACEALIVETCAGLLWRCMFCPTPSERRGSNRGVASQSVAPRGCRRYISDVVTEPAADRPRVRDHMKCHRRAASASSKAPFAAATKLRHAVSAERKLLTSQRKPRLSLQSIIGATLIFLFKFNSLSRIQKVIYQRILALLVRIIRENYHRVECRTRTHQRWGIRW